MTNKLKEFLLAIRLTSWTSPNAPLPMTFSVVKSSAQSLREVMSSTAGASRERGWERGREGEREEGREDMIVLIVN